MKNQIKTTKATSSLPVTGIKKLSNQLLTTNQKKEEKSMKTTITTMMVLLFVIGLSIQSIGQCINTTKATSSPIIVTAPIDNEVNPMNINKGSYSEYFVVKDGYYAFMPVNPSYSVALSLTTDKNVSLAKTTGSNILYWTATYSGTVKLHVTEGTTCKRTPTTSTSIKYTCAKCGGTTTAPSFINPKLSIPADATTVYNVTSGYASYRFLLGNKDQPFTFMDGLMYTIDQEKTTSNKYSINPSSMGLIPGNTYWITVRADDGTSTTKYTQYIAVYIEPVPIPASITIQNPTSGTYYKGNNLYIEYTGTNVSSFAIKLYKGGSEVKNVTTSTTSTSRYWTIPVDLTPDNNYTIKVYDATNSSIVATSSTFSILANPPANDECSNATSIPSPTNVRVTIPVNTEGATATTSGVPVPSCDALGNQMADVYYPITFTKNQRVTITSARTAGTIGGTIQILEGTCGNFTEVKCSKGDPTNNWMPRLSFDAVKGKQYYIRFMGYGETDISLYVDVEDIYILPKYPTAYDTLESDRYVTAKWVSQNIDSTAKLSIVLYYVKNGVNQVETVASGITNTLSLIHI